MKIAALVNEPNVGCPEARFDYDAYVVHKWCGQWQHPDAKKKHREPLFCRVEQGPVRCELCGRRAGKRLRQLILNNSSAYKCHEPISCSKDIRPTKITFYSFRRNDLQQEGIEGWFLYQRLVEELT